MLLNPHQHSQPVHRAGEAQDYYNHLDRRMRQVGALTLTPPDVYGLADDSKP